MGLRLILETKTQDLLLDWILEERDGREWVQGDCRISGMNNGWVGPRR